MPANCGVDRRRLLGSGEELADAVLDGPLHVPPALFETFEARMLHLRQPHLALVGGLYGERP